MGDNAQWPASLPLPQRRGYALEPGTATARTDMEAGAPRQRRRFTTQAPTAVPVRWRLSQAGLQDFEGFYVAVLGDGAAWFDTTLLVGTGMQPVEARFVGTYRAEPVGPTSWEVTAQMELRSRPIEMARVTEDGTERITETGVTRLLE